MKNRYLKIGMGILLILLLVSIGFVWWGLTPAGPMPEAVAALQSTPSLTVETSDWLIFQPVDQAAETGLIIYPGARVDPISYAPAAAAIAQQGYLVVITPMPLNLAVFDANRALAVMDAYPEVRSWAIAGHSLGGAMAANFARQNHTLINGLVLWAAYPANSDDLSNLELRVASIYATLDGLSTPEKIEATRHLLPKNTSWVAIQGGNHAQFGWYGKQNRDNPAQISRQDQQNQIIEATLSFLKGL